MRNAEAPVLGMKIVGEGTVGNTAIPLRALPASNEFPIDYRDNGLTVGGDIVRAHIEQEARKRIKVF